MFFWWFDGFRIEGLSAISIYVMQTCSVQALQEQLSVLAAAKKEKKPENVHGKKSEDSENAQNNRNGKDSEWRNQLSLSQERRFEKEMKHLEDKKRHEEQYAIKDGPEQLQEMHAEYARKESDVLKSYQHKAEHNLRGDPKEGSSEQPKPVELSDEDPGAMKEFVAQKAPKRKGGMETHLSFKVNGWQTYSSHGSYCLMSLIGVIYDYSD